MEKRFSTIKNLEDIKRFLFAGKAIITLESSVTGKHFTFKVKQAKKDDVTSPFFVSVLSGEDTYLYIGIINAERNKFNLTKNSKVGSDALSYKAFKYFFELLITGKQNPGLNVFHSGVCGRCGKSLTTPESIERGLGPECSKK